MAPGNAGTSAVAGPGVAPIRRIAPAASDPAAVVGLARTEGADLVIVGPEAPLCAGVADALSDAGIAVFGPRKNAAVLEGSKVFLKQFASRHRIPTAPYEIASDMATAEAIIRRRGAPIVVKADGLCAGKGVVVAQSAAEALEAAHAMLVLRKFGDAGSTIVLEDRIDGEEASVHAVSDGASLFVLPAARDHKRIFDGDRGPNTGGMGAVAPALQITPALAERIEREILRPTIDGMRAEGRPFCGTLFAGLMLTRSGDPVLLEHNVRFGDPECEVLTALLEGDFAELLASAARGALDRAAVRVVPDRHAVVVVLAAAGYPDAPATGERIHGLQEAAAMQGVVVHHAGTAERDGHVVTAGGRVLAVTATGDTAALARDRAYRAAQVISFDGKQMRSDIGAQRPAAAS